jgi:hypothetical protein
LATALELQSATVAHREDWDFVIAAFRQARSAPLVPLRERLFDEWRRHVAGESVGRHIGDREPPDFGWLFALVDAARTGTTADSFHDAVRECLSSAERSPDLLVGSLASLRTLTLDLDRRAELQRTAPTLRALLSRYADRGRAVDRTRREWIRKLGGESLLPDVVEFWRRNAARLVPDPAQAGGSEYSECADWLKAVFELNPKEFQRIVQRWRVEHKRRRNLWKAIAERGLPE